MESTDTSRVPTSRVTTAALRLADRGFRVAGVLTVLLLIATIGLGVSGVAAWRPVFTAAHVAALIAVLPLGLVLIRHAFREAARAGSPGLAGVIRRYRGTVALIAVALVAVVFSLANFEDGNRTVRRMANYTTVTVALVMIIRYLRWSRVLSR